MTLKQTHAQSIIDAEVSAVQQLLTQPDPSLQDFCLDSLGEFALAAYRRLDDLFQWQDFKQAKRFMMVGCGPFPITLLRVAKECPHLPILGIDNDSKAIALASQVLRHLTLSQIELLRRQGAEYVYDQEGIIYVANLVSLKTKVLRQIAMTASLGSLVILRDPSTPGVHLAEAGITDLSSAYQMVGEGASCTRFQSRHLFLRLVNRGI